MIKSRKLLLTIMAVFSLIIIYALIGCSSDDSNNCDCNAQFGNIKTGKYMYQQTDCDRTPPSEDWVFIKCVDKPDY